MNTLNILHPAQRVMYELGCFLAFWSNFELMLEVSIWKLSKADAKENCREINPLTAGRKKSRLLELLEEQGNVAAKNALSNVFEMADRNGWIHGHILNPRGDFSLLTRFRVEKAGNEFSITNQPIDTTEASFIAFYETFSAFEKVAPVSLTDCNDYLRRVQQ